MKKINTEVMSGFPIYALTLREILENLGFESGNDYIFKFTGDLELLDSYPLTLEDDGMGYGVNPKFITEISSSIYLDKESELRVFNLFGEKYENK